MSGPVTISGGATRNSWWNQLRADVLGRPLLRTGSVEAARRHGGARRRAPGSVGRYRRAHGSRRTEIEPDPAPRHDLDDGYQRLVSELAERGWLDGELAAAVGREAMSPVQVTR